MEDSDADADRTLQPTTADKGKAKKGHASDEEIAKIMMWEGKRIYYKKRTSVRIDAEDRGADQRWRISVRSIFSLE